MTRLRAVVVLIGLCLTLSSCAPGTLTLRLSGWGINAEAQWVPAEKYSANSDDVGEWPKDSGEEQ